MSDNEHDHSPYQILSTEYSERTTLGEEVTDIWDDTAALVKRVAALERARSAQQEYITMLRASLAEMVELAETNIRAQRAVANITIELLDFIDATQNGERLSFDQATFVESLLSEHKAVRFDS